MTLTHTVTPKELERQAQLVYEGQLYEAFLVDNGSLPTPLTGAALASAWLAAQITPTGYQSATGVIGVGAYNSGTARYEIAPLVLSFSCTAGSMVWDTLCLRIAGSAYLHSIHVESATVTIPAGQSYSYIISLAQND